MLQLFVLDTGVLGLLTHPRPSPEATACIRWLQVLLAFPVRVVLPAIADYELRREYLLRNNERALQKLDELHLLLEVQAITDTALKRGAELWAQTRQAGRPTSDAKALDGDCILVAQFLLACGEFGMEVQDAIIATTDVGDLSFPAPAARWQNIAAPTETGDADT